MPDKLFLYIQGHMLHRVSSCCSDFKHSLSFFFLHCTKGWSWVKRPTHRELPKSSQCRIFLSQPFIFLPRTVSTFLLFMPIQIAQSRRAQGDEVDDDHPNDHDDHESDDEHGDGS